MVYLFMAKVSFAQSPSLSACDNKNELCNPLKAKSLEDLVTTLVALFVKVGAIIVTIYVIYAGFLLVKAQGKPEAIKEGKKALTYALIGGLILLGAQTISTILKNTATSLQ